MQKGVFINSFAIHCYIYKNNNKKKHILYPNIWKQQNPKSTKQILHFWNWCLRAQCFACKLCSVSKTIWTFISFLYITVFLFQYTVCASFTVICVVYILHVWNKCYHAWSKICLSMMPFMSLFVYVPTVHCWRNSIDQHQNITYAYVAVFFQQSLKQAEMS